MIAASVVRRLEADGAALGLTAAGFTRTTKRFADVPVGRGARQADRLLDVLARLSPYLSASFGECPWTDPAAFRSDDNGDRPDHAQPAKPSRADALPPSRRLRRRRLELRSECGSRCRPRQEGGVQRASRPARRAVADSNRAGGCRMIAPVIARSRAHTVLITVPLVLALMAESAWLAAVAGPSTYAHRGPVVQTRVNHRSYSWLFGSLSAALSVVASNGAGRSQP